MTTRRGRRFRGFPRRPIVGRSSVSPWYSPELHEVIGPLCLTVVGLARPGVVPAIVIIGHDVANGVDHYAHVRGPSRVVGPLEEDEVAGLLLALRDLLVELTRLLGVDIALVDSALE